MKSKRIVIEGFDDFLLKVKPHTQQVLVIENQAEVLENTFVFEYQILNFTFSQPTVLSNTIAKNTIAKNTTSETSTAFFCFVIIEGNLDVVLGQDHKSKHIEKHTAFLLDFSQNFELFLPQHYQANWTLFKIEKSKFEALIPQNLSTKSATKYLSPLYSHYFSNIVKALPSQQPVLINQLFYQILSEIQQKGRDNNQENAILKIEEYLLLNISQPLPKSEILAKMCNMSVSSFKVKFQQVIGTSASMYFYEAQMSFALQLLKEGQPIKAIAQKLNYANASNFINAFKRKYSFSPTKYQEENQ